MYIAYSLIATSCKLLWLALETVLCKGSWNSVFTTNTVLQFWIQDSARLLEGVQFIVVRFALKQNDIMMLFGWNLSFNWAIKFCGSETKQYLLWKKMNIFVFVIESRRLYERKSWAGVHGLLHDGTGSYNFYVKKV